MKLERAASAMAEMPEPAADLGDVIGQDRALREPMESGRIVISRAMRSEVFPARFQLVAAMNPCPCGLAGDERGLCRCTADQISAYRGRISGPLLDRIDLHTEVSRPRAFLAEWEGNRPESSAVVARRVAAARAIAEPSP